MENRKIKFGDKFYKRENRGHTTTEANLHSLVNYIESKEDKFVMR